MPVDHTPNQINLSDIHSPYLSEIHYNLILPYNSRSLRKVAGSSPDKIIEFLVLGFTQPITEISTRKYFWGV
jgi:hypothetical protein